MMNKKIFKSFLILLTMVLLFSGCTSSNETSNLPVAGDSSNDINISIDSRPDMYGKVKKILGNEVVLMLAEVSERPAQGEMSEEDREKRRAEMQNSSAEERQKKMEDRIKFTGETENFIIPVGIPIISRSRGEITQLDLADIHEGSMLQIWFGEGEAEEDKTVRMVNVLQGQ